jgi:hypothetical protein
MQTEITEETLILKGYKEYRTSRLDHHDRNWAKAIQDENGNKLYQILFRYWAHSSSFDCQVCLNYPNNGYAWITYQGLYIEEVENFYSILFKNTNAIAYYARHKEISS